MSQSTTTRPLGQITRPRCPADSWPVWCDLVSITLPIGADDRKPPSIWKVDLADLIESCISFAACDPVDPRDILGDEEDLDGPIGPLPDLRDPHEWPEAEPAAPDEDPAIAFPGTRALAERMALPPISGGSDEAVPFMPSDEDWEDFHAWCAEVEARAALARLANERNPMFGYE